ncbi:BtrH N-terminal domain-containing protein [Microscilla marina]|uniref:Lantibiotic ABC transporter n=1 Tax=Microscilla marina ATCC 23134 TaxID=313606 RepID=A1ZL94_MICM2|nr:BtrH N-terminal domain-containing protein [Microscilla marina]EAY28648.1 conserved hypothetical protein [Microscilla marina ATCC 23134]
MIIEDFNPFIGQHCETTATGSLLKQLGIHLSEPMLFGLGEGLGFIFWRTKSMDYPFIGGRVKPDQLTQNICNHLGLMLEVKETSSVKKAWKNVKGYIDQGKAVGLKLDCYHLDYFTKKIHFAAHYAAMYGYDQTKAYLIDTQPQGSQVSTSLPSLALARSAKGAMASRNLSYTITHSGQAFDLKKAIQNALINNAQRYLNPPIQNLGYKGILKTATEVKQWFEQSKNIKHEFQTTAMLMERAGTGGALFRNIYRDFLKESYELLAIDAFAVAYERFDNIAQQWTQVADLLDQIGLTQHKVLVDECAYLLTTLSAKEHEVMTQLYTAALSI